MKKILALTTINNTVALKQAAVNIKERHGDIVKIDKIYFNDYEHPDVSLDPIVQKIRGSDIILVDIRGDIRIARELKSMLAGADKTVVVLIGGSRHLFALTRMGKFRGEMIFKPGRDRELNVDSYMKARKFSALAKKVGKILPFGMLKNMRDWILAQEYYMEGDGENLENLILMLLRNYAGVTGIGKVPPPRCRPVFGLYAPGAGIFEDIEEYKRKTRYDATKPSIGVLLYGGMHMDDTKPIADALQKHLEGDVNLFHVFSQVEYNLEAVRKYFKNISLLLNLQYFRIHGGPYGGDPQPTYDLLRDLDVPLLTGLRSYETEIEKWRGSARGINPLEVVLGVTLPELDGALEPVFVAGLERVEDSDFGKIKRISVLDDRIGKLGERLKRRLALRNRPASEKKIAVITYNYPPGEDNLASAGYLDVFKSLEIFLERLREEGYRVNVPPAGMKELFLSSGIVNSPGYIRKSGTRVSSRQYASWFAVLPGSVRREVVNKWGEPPGSIMVDGDDIILPGAVLGNVFLGVQPARGVHEDPDMAYHDKELPPHHQYLAFYFYLEKVFRADAALHFGMHGTLEFTKGKEVALSSECFPDILIGAMPNIYYYWVGNTSEATIAKRRSYAICISHASPPMKSSGLYEEYVTLEDLLDQYEDEADEKVLGMIEEAAASLHLPAGPAEARKELYRMKRRLIPCGLHVMDRKQERRELVDYLLGVARTGREFPSILKLLADEKGLDRESARQSRTAGRLEIEAGDVILKILEGEAPSWLPEGYCGFLRGIVERVEASRESKGLLRALDGRYILPARGGDPIRDPEVYPSGRGMYAFDPRLIPTVAAQARGERAADLLVQSYMKKHGRRPESVGIVLWGFETMKTGGDTVATILSLLGVGIKRKKNPWFKELEAIPLEEMKRPRIDVVITICGIFRDTLGTLVDLLDRAAALAAGLDEPHDKNFVRKHYHEMREDLGPFAMARIFGPSPTEYATSMRTLVESGSWNDERDLVKSYDDSMSYAYFKGGVEKNEEALGRMLRSVDLVTQERDNTEYEVTDLDHYYEFLGGLARSVRDKTGKQAEIMVVDSTEGETAVEDLRITIERATRTRTLNPRWIEGMLRHDFHGAKKIKDRTEYLLGFAATTGKVENWLFDEVAERLVFDEEMRKKLQANNPYAAMELARLLVETQRRGYWRTSKEKLEELRGVILAMEGDLEGDP